MKKFAYHTIAIWLVLTLNPAFANITAKDFYSASYEGVCDKVTQKDSTPSYDENSHNKHFKSMCYTVTSEKQPTTMSTFYNTSYCEVHNTPLFRFSKNGKSFFYLLGTYHTVDPKYLGGFAAELVKTVDASDIVYCESIDSPSTYSREDLEKLGALRKPSEDGINSLSQNSQNIIRPLIETDLKKYNNKLSLTVDELSIKSLIFITYHHHIMPFLYGEHTVTEGLDHWVINRAKTHKKLIKGLETHMDRNNHYSADKSLLEKFATEVLHDNKVMPQDEQIQKIKRAHAYEYLNVDSLYRDFSESNEGVKENSISARNEMWTSKMIGDYKLHATQNKTVFFAVGMAHLCNEVGLINLLLQQGFTVERMNSDSTWIPWKRWDQ